MRVAVYLPLLWSLALAALAARLAAGTAPRLTPLLLTTASVSVAASWCWSLVILAGMSARRVAWLRPLSGLRAGPTTLLPPAALTAAALLLLTVAATALLRLLLRRGRDARSAALLRVHGAELTVLDSPDVHAFAVGGWPGRGHIITTTALMTALDPTQRAVVLAHERSHTLRGHHLLGLLTRLAAAVNPLLLGLPALVDFACEREADELAAATVGDRHVTARTLATVALLQHRAARSARDVAFARLSVPARVQALLLPEKRTSPLALSVTAALVLSAALSGIDVAGDADRIVELLKAR